MLKFGGADMLSQKAEYRLAGSRFPLLFLHSKENTL